MSLQSVFFVDDNPVDRRLTHTLLERSGFTVRSFSSAEEFLRIYAGEPGCLLLDVCMPGMGGPELQEQLAERGHGIPILFLSGQTDVETVSRVFRRGAIDYLPKPCSQETMAARLQMALERDADRRRKEAFRRSMRQRLEHLTPREREVMTHLVRSRTAREIGAELGLSPKTVQVHRAHILKKTRARSVIDLTRLAFAAGVEDLESSEPPP